MPTYYVEDYDGERNKDAVEREAFTPVASSSADAVQAKVVEPAKKAPAKKTTAKAETK